MSNFVLRELLFGFSEEKFDEKLFSSLHLKKMIVERDRERKRKSQKLNFLKEIHFKLRAISQGMQKKTLLQ